MVPGRGTVLFYEDVGGAVDVEVGNRLAASATYRQTDILILCSTDPGIGG